MNSSNAAQKTEIYDLTIPWTFSASREDIFKAWTKSRHLINWWAGGDVTMTAHKMDIHPGGLFHCDFKETNGNVFSSQGVYQEMIEPSHLAFSHSWIMNGEATPDTHVAVELSQNDGKTEMVFYQSGFLDAANRDQHERGWNNCFAKLEKYLANEAVEF